MFIYTDDIFDKVHIPPIYYILNWKLTRFNKLSQDKWAFATRQASTRKHYTLMYGLYSQFTGATFTVDYTHTMNLRRRRQLLKWLLIIFKSVFYLLCYFAVTADLYRPNRSSTSKALKVQHMLYEGWHYLPFTHSCMASLLTGWYFCAWPQGWPGWVHLGVSGKLHTR